MYFLIVPMFERGVKRDLKVIRSTEPVRGDVQIHADQFGPMDHIAPKASVRGGMPLEPDRLPPLYDVKMEGMATLGFVLCGTEIVDGVMYRQAWHCRELPEKVPWSACPRSELDALI